jgi:hypothetical protein
MRRKTDESVPCSMPLSSIPCPFFLEQFLLYLSFFLKNLLHLSVITSLLLVTWPAHWAVGGPVRDRQQ